MFIFLALMPVVAFFPVQKKTAEIHIAEMYRPDFVKLEVIMKKIVIARLYIQDSSVDTFKKLAAGIIQETRKEKGCLIYNLLQDVIKPGEFLFYEEYADQAALDAHSKSAYLNDFRINTRTMRSKDATVDIF